MRRVQAGFILVGMSGSAHEGGLRDAGEAGGDALALRGAKWARAKTRAPIVVTFPAFAPWALVEVAAKELLEEAAVPGGGVVLTGMDGGRSQPLESQVALLRQGFLLCFDRFGAVEWSLGPDYCPPDEESAVRIAKLVEMGFAEQVMISQGVSKRLHLSR